MRAFDRRKTPGIRRSAHNLRAKKLKQRTPIRRISLKRLEREFGGKIPYSTIRPRSREERITVRRPFELLIPKKWLRKPAVIHLPDGREICNPWTPEGRAEREWRKLLMWVRQDGRCSIGEETIKLKYAVFEHANPKKMGGADTDDRISDPAGKPLNSVACAYHNRLKGSRRDVTIHFGDNTTERRKQLSSEHVIRGLKF